MLFIFKIPKKIKVCFGIPLKNKGILLDALSPFLIGERGRSCTYGVSYVADLQSAAFATRHTRPKMEPDIGLEPMTRCLQGSRSCLLS